MAVLAGVLALLGLVLSLAALVGLIAPSLFKDKKTGEVPKRLPLFLGGTAAALIALGVASAIAPQPDDASEKPSPAPALVEEAPAVSEKVITYTAASSEALDAATQLMEDLDAAMLDGMGVLKTGDAHTMGAHSRRISALVESAYTNFGSTIFEPLGRCGVASNYVRSWWNAQHSAARKGGVESVPGEIQHALEQFLVNRESCLQAFESVPVKKGFECLGTYERDPETGRFTLKPKPAHCKS